MQSAKAPLRRGSVAAAAAVTILCLLSSFGARAAEVSPETLKSLSAPDKIETSIGTLEFKDGAPSAATAAEGLRHTRLHPRP